MQRSKSSGKEKRRSGSQCEEQLGSRRKRLMESTGEASREDLADAELDRVGSDIEEGGLDLAVPFQPISGYVGDREEMLQQCFHVLGEKKLSKMMPDELKGCTVEEIKKLCWEQLQRLSQNNLLQILAGEELTSGDDDKGGKATLASQQDNNVDSTSSIKETGKTEEPKQEGSGEESDVLSIHADTCDSDMDELKADPSAKAAAAGAARAPGPVPVLGGAGGGSGGSATTPLPTSGPPPPPPPPPGEAKKDLEKDIDKSVSEILALSSKEEARGERSAPASQPGAPPRLPAQGPAHPAAGGAAAPGQPSVQQLELLELEMRARAIKALMKAGDGKKP